MNILVAAAHPDDEALGCGGTIKKFVDEGHDVRVLTFTDGGKARDGGSDRRYQLFSSSKILGFSILDTFGFPDNAMDSVSLLAINQATERLLIETKFTPEIILTHNPWCLNVDHKKVFECVQVLTRISHCKVMCFEIPSSSEWNHVSEFKANCYVKLNQSQVDAKIESLRKSYAEEMRQYPHPRSIENIFNSLRTNGSVIGVEYAERFLTTKEVI
jgi:LmbE family N-acetylglucosaminyl deacetylase